VGMKKKIINAVKFSTVYIGTCGKLEHTFQADGRFFALTIAFTDETGPHCIVKFKR
jgi:hypothetical protein